MCMNFPVELNSGYVLWIQQFYGLLVKRFLHSIRNWRAVIIQVVLPVMFILLGLILIETVPSVSDPDELREMSLTESALDEDDITTFFADFGNTGMFTVSNLLCHNCTIAFCVLGKFGREKIWEITFLTI